MLISKSIKKKVKLLVYRVLNFQQKKYVVEYINDLPSSLKLFKSELILNDLDLKYLESQKLMNFTNEVQEVELEFYYYTDVILDSFNGTLISTNLEILNSSLKFKSQVPYTYLSKVQNVDYSLDQTRKYVFISNLDSAYFHKWFDGLIQLYYVKALNESCIILIPEGTSLKIKNLLLNFKEEFDFKFIDDRFLYLKNVYKFKHVSWAKHAPLITPDIANFFKKRILNQNYKIKTYEKIFIGRRNTTNRKIKNDEEIISVFENFNFKVIYLEDFSIPEQAYLFNNANYIAGLHGAGFTNLIFCEPNTKIIELQNLVNVTTYFMISHQLNLNYYYILPNEFDFDKIKHPYIESRSFFQQKLKDTSYNINEINILLKEIA
ncbi:glycosyltransferase family 61 protein [Psychroflexus sp. CAK8W]|uniref:Glycosyltransferase family 61 protein n=1 Tax=Psychroflexus longus TaxID=2873596 RepID=A0ABS7XM17_9FLAO|nr:glycosyltransferase family 61 protein [Psychroflexus longus]MBZ9779434.1 glycosyltransferase family 61 protein [Psychroflexus longus]